MIENFTQDFLILYLYKELNEKENQQIENALETDWSLQEQLGQLKSTMRTLDSGIRNPSQSSIDIIMNYSKELGTVSVAN